MLHRLLIRILLIACITFGYVCGYSARADNQSVHHVEDLAYGVALFDFFQQKYFSAITDLLVAEHYQRIKSDENNPSLLLGGLYLSYDLHQQSAKTFNKLLGNKSGGMPITIQDQARFLLGKNHYNDGLFSLAEEQFVEIKDGLQLESEDEKLFLLNAIFLKNDDFFQAQKTLEYFSSESVWKGYAKFNVASRLIQHPVEDNVEKGFDLLAELAIDDSLDYEKRILKDKANLALAYVSLRDGDSEKSIEYFNEVRLKGIETNKALLGIGWARYRENEFKEAVIPWMHLASSQTESDLAVQEAFISIPYAFEKMELKDQALHHYVLALDSYKFQLDETQQLVKFIKSSAFIEQLNQGSLGKEITSAVSIIKNLDPLLTRYLLPLLSSNDYQYKVKSYLEVVHLKYMLNHWQNNIPALQMILSEKRKTYKNKLSKTMDDDSLNRIKVLINKRRKLADQIKKIELSEESLRLLTAEEAEYLKLLDKGDSHLGQLKTQDEETVEIKNKVRLLKGRMVWEVDTDYPVRIWAVRKQLKQLNVATDEMSDTMSSLESAWKTAPSDFSGFEVRIANKEAHIKQLKKKIDIAIVSYESELRAIALEDLRLHRNQIKLYHDRALYAKARLYDSLMERE
ncbi:MAG: hypothetical protein DIZ80_12740 [endosymbiont of Galathealinum brachiosum]|uniref:Tetratricopeptide repeat-like domain-containing protein n=1 Tax=endosymbiont of Galathealinum brachiosum TaxID=2200906 RepID=A0A370DFL9_9GAMM|nr:MAG: hypothetical protein DIZ80_12740 [endosymbiont of Galathealinum brachiosum]